MRSEGKDRLALSVSEAAALLGVSRPTVYELLNRDDFPSFRIGSRRVISRAGLERWVEQQADQHEEGASV